MDRAASNARVSRWVSCVRVGGALLSIIGMTVAREAISLAGTDIATLYPQHAADLSVGGLPLFLAFFAINAAVVGWCFRLVHRGRLKMGGGA